MNFRLMALNIREFCPDLSLVVIKQRINIRYRQIVGMENWEFLKDSTTVTLKGIQSSVDGVTVAVDQYGTAVTGTGTTFAQGDTGWFFRFGSEAQPYVVDSVTSDTALTLETSYGGTTQTSSSYDLFQTIYSPSVGDVGEITGIVYQQPLVEKSEGFLNRLDPERSSTGEPRYYRVFTKSKADGGTVSFEVWPTADENYVVTVFYRKVATALSEDTDEPIFRAEVLEAGSLYDCYRLAFARTNNPAYVGLARDAKVDYFQLLRELIAEDIETSSMPATVRDVSELRRYDDNFVTKHDVGMF